MKARLMVVALAVPLLVLAACGGAETVTPSTETATALAHDPAHTRSSWAVFVLPFILFTLDFAREFKEHMRRLGGEHRVDESPIRPHCSDCLFD